MTCEELRNLLNKEIRISFCETVTEFIIKHYNYLILLSIDYLFK